MTPNIFISQEILEIWDFLRGEIQIEFLLLKNPKSLEVSYVRDESRIYEHKLVLMRSQNLQLNEYTELSFRLVSV